MHAFPVQTVIGPETAGQPSNTLNTQEQGTAGQISNKLIHCIPINRVHMEFQYIQNSKMFGTPQ